MLSYPIYMDTTGVFRRTNPQLPSNPMLHTFLLDENNEVLAVGNPLENEKIDRMFWRTVKEKLGTRQKENEFFLLYASIFLNDIFFMWSRVRNHIWGGNRDTSGMFAVN